MVDEQTIYPPELHKSEVKLPLGPTSKIRPWHGDGQRMLQ